MAVDAFDPGPKNDHPFFPRDSQGRPLWSDHQGTDKTAGDNGAAPMPRGWRREHGRQVDVTPRKPDGTPMIPPSIPRA